MVSSRLPRIVITPGASPGLIAPPALVTFPAIVPVGPHCASGALANRQPTWISCFVGRRREKIGLDGAGHLDHERLTSAVERLACGGPNPLLADTIFLDVAPLDAAKAHANAARQRRLVIERARRVDAEPVGRNVGHLRSSAPVSTRGRAISRRAP